MITKYLDSLCVHLTTDVLEVCFQNAQLLLGVVIVFFCKSLFVIRPTARRKPEPVSDSGEAQKKFGGDVKAISSDMYFGKQDNSEVHNDDMHPNVPSPHVVYIYCVEYFYLIS